LVVQEQGIAAAGFPRAAELCLMHLEQGLTVTTDVVIYTVIWDCRAQLQRVTGGRVVRSCSSLKDSWAVVWVPRQWGDASLWSQGVLVGHVYSCVHLRMLLSSRILMAADNKPW